MKKVWLLIFLSYISVNVISQNVGIGTTTPTTRLHVSGTAGNIATFSGGTGMWITLAEGASNRGYIGSYAGNAEDVDFGTYSTNTTGKVHLTTGTNQPRLTVTETGNVGIGTTNPNQLFSVAGGMNIDQNDANSGTPVNGLRFGGNGSGEAIGSRRTAGANQWGLDFYTNSVQRMSITLGGNVGIGTNTPNQKLQINGAIKIADVSGSPTEGTIRFNPINKDFEGYDGRQWLSLTASPLHLPQQTDTISNQQTDYNFGYCVKTYEDWLFVGSPYADINGQADQGSVTVYKKNPFSEKYELFQTLTASGGQAGDLFGYAIDIGKTNYNYYLIIGAPFSDVNGISNRGAVYIFCFFSNNNEFGATSPAYLVPVGGSSGEGFGSSIASYFGANNFQLLIGSPKKTAGSNLFQGGAYFVYAIANSLTNQITWDDHLIINNPSPAALSYFGNSVCIGISPQTGFILAIGNPGAAVNGNGSQGKVNTFNLHYTYDTVKLVVDSFAVSSNGNAGDGLGSNVIFDPGLNLFFVSAPNKEVGSNNEQGTIYVYKDTILYDYIDTTIYQGSLFRHAWLQKGMITAPDGLTSDKLGNKIHVKNGYLFAGAVNRDEVANNAGIIYVFQKANGNGNYNFIYRKKIADMSGNTDDMLGESFDINGNQIIIGVPNYDAPGRFNTGKIIFSSIF
jgi:hypothetical protein